MAGHSHWAGIKHKKGRVDKQRSKIFSKLSKEITVAAKLGSKDPNTNPRLRSAILSARTVNMPKDNIERAIKKSETNKNLNYNTLMYEGFGPEKIAIIIEALTDNKNRTVSNIRTIFQKFGGSLGESGAVSHQFKQVGIIRIDKKKISDNEILELAINAGAEDCSSISLNAINRAFCNSFSYAADLPPMISVIPAKKLAIALDRSQIANINPTIFFGANLLT